MIKSSFGLIVKMRTSRSEKVSPSIFDGLTFLSQDITLSFQMENVLSIPNHRIRLNTMTLEYRIEVIMLHLISILLSL
jgi:hypothetical protein